MLHIVILPSWYPDNANDINGSFFREQAIALKNQGCKVGVISLKLRPLSRFSSMITGRYDTEFESDQGVATYRKHGVGWFPLMPRLKAWLWKRGVNTLFERYVQEHGKPDIIHVHSMLYAGWAAKNISDKYLIPYVVTEHSSVFAHGSVTKTQKNIAKQVLLKAKARFAVSRPFADFLTTFFGVSGKSWGIVPNIVQKDFFDHEIKDYSHQKTFVFINIAFMTANKGQAVLIKAFAKAHFLKPDIKLKIGGDGEEFSKLKALARDLGVEDHVEFLGVLSRQQVAEQVGMSDAFVLSSYYETFGVVVAEALALGKPVIATRCGGPEDIIHKSNGILVSVGNIDALVEAMLTLCNTRDLYRSKVIREACRMRYGEHVVTQYLIGQYNHVLAC